MSHNDSDKRPLSSMTDDEFEVISEEVDRAVRAAHDMHGSDYTILGGFSDDRSGPTISRRSETTTASIPLTYDPQTGATSRPSNACQWDSSCC